MALRHRLVLLATGTVALVVLAATVASYLAIRAELRSQVDDALAAQGGSIQALARRFPRPLPQARIPGPVEPGEAVGIVQVVGPRGRVLIRSSPRTRLPVTAADRALIRRGTGRLLGDRTVDGRHLRVLVVPVRGGGVQLARSLESSDATLARLRVVLALLWLVATALAFAVSSVLARRLEASRAALAASVAAQRQLVADASHELRTPVTGLRTNIEVLLEPGELGEEDRRRLLEDLRDQAEEVGELMDDVIESARGDHPLGPLADVRLDAVVEEGVERARRRAAPGVAFTVEAEPTIVRGAADRLGRAVANLLDNAVKHSPPEGTVTVMLRDGVLAVADEGPGVPDDVKPRVFDRFYSAGDGRSGYGLGLSIVKQAATAHGGAVEVGDAAGGGAVFRLRLPEAVSSAPRR